MFASQLLRILETLPGDVKYEPCAFDTAELKVRMKENQNGILCHSDGYHKEEESLSFKTKDLRHSNGHGKDADPLALRKLERIDFWNVPELERSTVVDDCIKDNETGIRVSPTKKDQSGFLYHLSGGKRDEDPLTSDRKDRNKLWNAPEFECSMKTNDFSNQNKHESQDSGSPFVTSSELFPAETHFYTDKNVMESELPELTVRYNEINYHVVKDLCIDEGLPVEDEGLTERHTDDRAGLSVSLPSNEFRQNMTSDGRLDFELLIPDGPKASREEDIDDADKCGTKEEMNIISLASGKPKCFQESSANKDGRSPDDVTQAGETKSKAPNKIENDVSEEESIVTSMLPLQVFGTRSFLRSFMDTLNNDGDEVPQQPNQIHSIVANLESITEAKESNKNGSANKSFYNSKVENGTITFDFDSPKPAAADSRGRSAETIEQSLESDYGLNHNDGNTNNPLAASLVQHPGMDGSTLNIHQESVLNPKNSNSNNPFIVSKVQGTSMDGSTENFHQETLVNHKKGSSNNPFAIDEVQNESMDQSTENIHQSPMLSHKKGNFNPFAFSEVESASMDSDTENIHRTPMLNPKNGKSNNPFAVSEFQNASMDVSSESIHQQPALNHEIGNTTNPFAVYEVQASSMDGDTENIHQQPELKHNTGNSSNPFATSEVQRSRMDGITTNIHGNPLKLDNTPDHRNETEKSLSSSNQIQCASSMAENTEVLNKQSFEPQDVPNHEGTSNNISINDQGQYGNGETSFSAAGPASGLITYSGPITYSGSTSLRSDSSTTSTRSFAFPVLQSEWNSSPVRMGKADARHFRKHRGWKQGILCCRF